MSQVANHVAKCSKMHAKANKMELYNCFYFTGKMDLEAKNTLEWYKGRSVFITGATGFMGKVLIEKLLYSYPDIKNIYILIRSKRGRSTEERIEDMWKLPVKNIIKKIARAVVFSAIFQ